MSVTTSGVSSIMMIPYLYIWFLLLYSLPWSIAMTAKLDGIRYAAEPQKLVTMEIATRLTTPVLMPRATPRPVITVIVDTFDAKLVINTAA